MHTMVKRFSDQLDCPIWDSNNSDGKVAINLPAAVALDIVRRSTFTP